MNLSVGFLINISKDNIKSIIFYVQYNKSTKNKKSEKLTYENLEIVFIFCLCYCLFYFLFSLTTWILR